MKSSDKGFTLAEVLIATTLICIVFVLITSLYGSSLKLFNREAASPDVDTLLALETMTRKITLAHEAIVDAGGSQLKLRIDSNDPATSSIADDQWITYRFLGATLRSKTVNPPNAAAADVTVSDPEVVPGLVVVSGATLSEFKLINPSAVKTSTVVEVQLVVSGGAASQNRTFLSDVALRSAK